MALPTPSEITRLFLYGTTTLPNLVDQARIRPDVTMATAFVLPVNVNEYMAGPGRFVSATHFEAIVRFFQPSPLDPQSQGLQPSPEGGYTREQLYAELGLDGDGNLQRRAAFIRQTDYDDSALPGGIDDLFERSYIWQTTAFQIDPNARFHVGADGTRWITNFRILPFSTPTAITPADHENFDFVGDGLASSVANPILEQVIDPSRIGRTVNIEFDGFNSLPVIPIFTLDDFNAAANSPIQANAAANLLRIRAGANAFAQQFFNDGTARFLDGQNRPILYGTDQADFLAGGSHGKTNISEPVVRNYLNIPGLVASHFLLEIGQPLAPFVQNGIAYIAGKGADRITGTSANDYLAGGPDNDLLNGGRGADTYVWNAGDGLDRIIDVREADAPKSGTIEFLGQSLAGTKTQVDPNNPRVFQDSRGILYTLTGLPGAEGMLQVRAGPGDTTGFNITQFRSGDYDIVIPTPAPIQKTDIFGTDDHDFDLASSTSEQRVFGLAGNDRMLLTHANTEGHGGLGSDFIINGVGDQKLYGDEGSDFLLATAGFDELYGGPGGDALQGGGDDDYLEGNGGGDVLDGGAGADVIYGGDGNDFIQGGGTLHVAQWSASNPPSFGTITVDGVTGPSGISGVSNAIGDGADFIDGGAGIDTIFPGEGNDFARGGSDNDLVAGLEGDDILEGNDGADALYGDVTQGQLTVAGQQYYAPPELHGSDVLSGGAGNDFLTGDGGSDELYGEGDDDTLVGDADGLDEAYHGADYLDGGGGNDTLFGYGKDDTLFGGDGNDRLEGDSSSVPWDKHGDDYLDGEAGDDHIQGDGGADTLFGGEGPDQLFGDSDDTPPANQGDDYLDGEGGNDYLRGYAGDDVLFGGDGNDEFLAEAGDDYIDGEAGDDLMSGGEGSDQLFGGLGNDDLQSDAGDDFLDGGDGNDLLSGGSGADQLLGGAGVDQLVGGDGNDSLDGGDEADTLFGEAGDDVLIGGAGADTLVGGAGSDIYVAAFEGDGIVDSDPGNALQAAYAGAPSALTIQQGFDAQGVSYLVLSDANGQILIQNGFAGAVSSFDFGSGTVLTREQLMAQAQVSALTLFGGAASQHLIGGSQADHIDGGLGADTLQGGGGNDSYVVDDAADVIVESAGEGVDSVTSSVTYTLGAEVENLTLAGAAAIDAAGNALANALTGNAAGNTLDGAAGNDTLAGGFGGDSYLFGRGYGQDVIQESDDGTAPVDRALFAADTLAADVAVSRTASDLILTISGTGDAMTVAGYFTSPAGIVEEFHFADGTIWDEAVIAQKLSNGTPGNDVITGTAGNDILNGLAGNDTISGLAGDDRLFGSEGLDTLNGNDGADILDPGVGSANLFGGNGGDTYVVERGYGQVFISETDNGSNPVDRVAFGADILPQQVVGRRNGLNLVLTVSGTSDRVTISNYFANDAVGPAVVEEIRLGDGTIWNVAALKAMVLVPTEDPDALTGYAGDEVIDGLGGNDTIEGGGGNDSLRGGAGADVLRGGAGDDTLGGGAGDDALVGGAGNDTYLYDVGGGLDTIFNDDASTATTDRLVFGAGLLPSNLSLTRGGTASDLFIGQGQGVVTTLVTVTGYFSSLGGPNEIDEIRFADDPATVWTVAGVRAMLLAANDNPNTLVGYDTNDTIDGLGGDDFIQGAEGNDSLFGGTGNDTIAGGRGTDALQGGAGDDLLYGEEQSQDIIAVQSGGDTLDGGAGRDQLFGRRGNDIYVFGRGYGHDSIDEATVFSDGSDTLRLNAGVLPVDVTLYRHADDLVVTIAGDAAQAWVSQYFTLANKPIEQIVFDNGTVWNAATIASLAVTGTQNAMTGTAGNDTFVVDHVGDTISEGANQGTDTVQASVSYNIPANVENITLTGLLDINSFGNDLNNTMNGNAGDNELGGGGGADTLNGGAGHDTLSGDNGDDVLNGGAGSDKLDGAAGIDTLAGGSGDDTYTLGSFNEQTSFDTVTELAGEGADTVIANLQFYTLAANVEHLVMGSNTFVTRTATGNALDNTITVAFSGVVSSQNFVIDGGAGADRMIGNYSVDTFVVDNAGDVVVETALFADGSQGSVDTVRSSLDYVLGANIENLELQAGSAALIGTGNALNNSLVGNASANTLYGVGGNDTLFGGFGADTLIGGQGDDTYVIADVRTVGPTGSITYSIILGSVNEDILLEGANEGVDTVRSFFNYTLGDHFENLELLEQASLSPPVLATGNALANRITGNQEINVIDGREGADTMIGRSGNDTYHVDNVDDVVQEQATEGAADAVIAQVSYTLGEGFFGNVEKLILSGTAAISGTGNSLANTLDGSQNTAANVLAGGFGNDIYIVGSGDTIVETADGGIDVARSDASFTLGANVESLVLTGAAATTGTGDALDNTLDGSQNSAANTLVGGLGDDSYIVDGSDLIVENAGEGTDTVLTAAVTYTLGANVENLTLTGGAFEGIGNAENNLIIGNAFSNLLDGLQGADTMRGMGGGDTYTVDDAADVVDETNGGVDAGGIEMVFSPFSYTLGAYLENLTLMGADPAAAIGNALDNTLSGNSGANVLDGGAGADTMMGNEGDDTYRFGRGYGNDSIWDSDATAGNMDTVEMAADVAPGDISATRSGSDLVLSISGTADSLTLLSFFSGTANEIERVVFAGGTIWDVETLRQMGAITGTSGADTLNGTAGDDNISGLAGNDTLNGLDGNDFLDGGTGNDSMNGGLGDDTYLVDNTGDIVTESSSTGGFDTVISEVTWTLGSNVEILLLDGEGVINGTGNSLDNTLAGNITNNTLDGRAGADWMSGWLGNDTYVVDNLGDVVVENADEGIDTVQSSVSHTLSADVENLTLTLTSPISGTGNELNNVLTGNSGANTLTGGAGNDTLNGGGGADTMIGGAGDDLYVRDVTNDVVTELANDGIDTVQSAVTYTLTATVENLTLTGTTNGISGTGNALNNVLTGNSGTNTLTGLGGDDTYFVTAGDTTTEAANGGIDTVRAGVNWTLLSNVENLTLTGTSALNGTGNTQNNLLIGNIANNTLSGAAGADTMVGGLGNDTYVVDNAADVVTELAGEGTDLVQSTIAYTLAAEVENLTLMGSSGLSGTGNALNNVLTGNSGTNLLTGGAGDDTYVVTTGDTTTELANAGIDTVMSGVNWTLANNVENLTLTGTGAISGTGNALNNVLTGNSGNNPLNGMGCDDTYFIATGDTVTEAAGGGEDLVNIGATHTLVANVENLILTGTTAINGTGNGSNNLLRGNSGVNTLAGAAGNDILEGGGGNDILGDTGGANLFNGQAGTDTLNGNTGKELLIGGAANDTVNTSSGADIIAFNRGDGADTVAVSTVKDNSLSLGGGIAYTDLFFQKSGNNLILKTAGAAGAEQVTFTNWYAATANRSVLNLQMVVEASADFDAGSADPLRNRKVAEFNFDALVSQFDAALAANPGLTSWALNNALTSFHLGGSDSEALGGDLAYRYGLQGNLSAVGSIGAQNVLGAAQFGTAVQAFQAQSALEAGMMRLT